MEIHKRLLLFERDPEGSLRKPQLCTRSFARGFLGACDVITTDDPLRGGSNDPEDVRRGLELFPKVRKAWRKLRDKKVARAILDWNEATLTLKAINLGVIPGAEAAWARADVIDVLEDARERLLSPVEISAISADLAAAHRPDAVRMRATLESLRTTPHLELPPNLAGGLEEVLAARSQADLTAALQSFRGTAEAMGAPPSLFSYELDSLRGI